MPKCPECTADISLAADTMPGEICSCPDCGEEYEIVSTTPFQIRKAETVGEDWGQ